MVKQALSLLATPLFLVGSFFSYLDHGLEHMTLMWLTMALAHLPSWLAWWDFRRYRLAIQPNRKDSSDSSP